jgi:hypothetical protein
MAGSNGGTHATQSTMWSADGRRAWIVAHPVRSAFLVSLGYAVVFTILWLVDTARAGADVFAPLLVVGFLVTGPLGVAVVRAADARAHRKA